MYKLNLTLKNAKLLISLLVLMQAVILMMLGATYFSQSTLKIATVNVTGMVSNFVKETSQQNLTMEQKQEKVNKFGLAMQHVMDTIAKQQHVVIIMSEAVIAGSVDLTQEVMVGIKRELKL